MAAAPDGYAGGGSLRERASKIREQRRRGRGESGVKGESEGRKEDAQLPRRGDKDAPLERRDGNGRCA